MRWDGFLRWYDWIARAHFAGTIMSAVIGAAAGFVAYFEGWDWLAIFLAMLGTFAALGILYIASCYFWDRFGASARLLKYLTYRDSELGEAIRAMTRHSAWGKWYAAQMLVNSGRPATEEYVLQIATSNIAQNLIDGDIEVRGRLPGEMDYRPIPRTYWRSTVPHFIADPQSLWRMILIPKGGAQIEPSGNVIADNPVAAERTAQITKYDSLLVNGYQFEKCWPKTDALADKKRHQFLREARRRGLDKDEIRQLS